jgi:hypothetical protein
VAGAHLRGARHQTAERKRPRGCKSTARRDARAQPVVPAVAAVRRLLPNRVSSAPTGEIGEVDAATIRMPPLAYCDNNFVITAHDAPQEYKVHLREIASGGKVTLPITSTRLNSFLLNPVLPNRSSSSPEEL